MKYNMSKLMPELIPAHNLPEKCIIPYQISAAISYLLSLKL